MPLVIVESPKKAKTIKGFLGADYQLTSSYGHIRDLPKSDLGVDVENNFEPQYEVPDNSKKTINALEEKIKKSDGDVILATDEDREGEAIAWHLSKLLDIDPEEENRIVFHEITNQAIKDALENPREIDKDLVDAQQARRVLDRLVGYKLSPLLWKKIYYGLSAGRVQSVALRLICDREEEREEFDSEEYWTITAQFSPETEEEDFQAKLFKTGGEKLEKFDLTSEKEAQKLKEKLEKKNYQIKNVEKEEKKKNPFPPYITASLQQDASYRLNFSSGKTMFLAQNLYEGVNLGGDKQQGLITYHRTDSTNMASAALGEAKKVIKEKYGEKYLKTRQWKTDEKGAEEAHEAIRPTSFKRDPESIKKYLKDDEFKLYQLIYQRGLASQMSAAVFDKTKLVVGSLPDTEYEFKALGQIIKFDGFLDMYPIKTKQERLPDLKEGDKTDLLKVDPEQHFTRPPGRFSEASLIKELKEDGIGRPSTYATIMKTIKDRNYVRKERKSLVPTKVGRTVNKLLVDHFPQIVDIDFTANMEENLDQVARGKRNWQDVISEFYQPFAERLERKMDEISKKDIVEEEIDEECPECGAPLVKKLSKNGEFISCSRFPDCKYARSIEKKIGIDCPECEEGEIVEKKTKKGKTFYGCSNYPDCEFALWQKPNGEKCPKCGSLLVKSNSGKTIYCPEKECDYKKSVND